MSKVIDLLSVGTITSAGGAGVVIDMVKENQKLLGEIFNLFLDKDPVVAMRSSYVFMKLSKSNRDLILPFRTLIIDNLPRYVQKEVRWHIPQILLVMDLSDQEKEITYNTLMSWAEGKDGNIVVYYSLEAAFNIAKGNNQLLANFIPRLKNINKTDAKIVKNRCKKIANNLMIKLD
jgi:hypothetical protein